ncbi:hypothetical protein ACMAY8_17620 [Rhodobacteraceae bacterium nBUS_22]
MAHATLKHVNYCTPDPLKTAAWMADLFGWKIRWLGDGRDTAACNPIPSASIQLRL